MIGIGVAEHDGVQPPEPQRPQRRQHHPFAGVESIADRRAGIEQQGVPLGPHQHCQTLPDIEHLQIGLAGFGQGTVRPQQRQPQQQRH